MDSVTIITVLIGFLVIAAAYYLNQEDANKTYKPTPIVRQPDPEPEDDEDVQAPKPKKKSSKKKKSQKKKSSKKKKKKKKIAAARAAEAKQAAEAAAKDAIQESKTSSKKKTKADVIAGVSKDGTSGLYGASRKIDKADNEGWELVKPTSGNRSPRKTEPVQDDGNVTKKIACKNLGKLIGKKGENIKSYSEQTGARIDTPERGSSSNVVTVTGTQAEVDAAISIIEKLNAEEPEKKNVVSVKHTVNNIGRLIGKGGSTIKGLSTRFDVRIDTPETRKPKGNIVTISGESQVNVDKCLAEVKDILGDDDATPQVNETVKLTQKQTGLIIGSGGATVRGLEQEHGARINVNKETLVCRISGAKAAVAAAAKAVRAILKKDARNITESIPCDSSRFGLVIGKGGATITRIENEFKVKVNADKATNSIKIIGEPKGVKGAKAEYIKILTPVGPFGALPEGAKSKVISVPDSLKGRVIGSGGATIKKLQQETGAKIDFRDDKKDEENCRLAGSDEQIAAAEKKIEEIKAKAKEQNEKAEAARAATADDVEEEEKTEVNAATWEDNDQSTGW